MQGQSYGMTAGAVNITSPSACEGFRLYSLAHTFTFQWVSRSSEIAATSGVSAGEGVGAAISAEENSATDFFIEVHAPRGNPFIGGEVIGIAIGTNGDTLYARPIRVGNS